MSLEWTYQDEKCEDVSATYTNEQPYLKIYITSLVRNWSMVHVQMCGAGRGETRNTWNFFSCIVWSRSERMTYEVPRLPHTNMSEDFSENIFRWRVNQQWINCIYVEYRFVVWCSCSSLSLNLQY
jgi:hypothetical protein